MGRRPAPCAHCHGTGLCDQVCCTTFGNARHNGEQVIRVCMTCLGTGRERGT